MFTPAFRARPRFAVVPLLALALLLAACAPVASAPEPTAIYSSAPWQEGERLEYALRDDAGEVIGHGVLLARMEDGRLLLEQIYTEADVPEGATPIEDDVVVVVDPETFAPLQGRRDIVRRAEDGSVHRERYEWEYRDVEGERRLFTRHLVGDRVQERDVRLREDHYDNETSLWLWRAAELVEDLDEHYVSVNALENSQQTVQIRVPQVETIEVPAGEFQAWRIIVRTGRAARTAWINVDPPHEVLRWDNGEIVFDLERRTIAE